MHKYLIRYISYKINCYGLLATMLNYMQFTQYHVFCFNSALSPIQIV